MHFIHWLLFNPECNKQFFFVFHFYVHKDKYTVEKLISFPYFFLCRNPLEWSRIAPLKCWFLKIFRGASPPEPPYMARLAALDTVPRCARVKSPSLLQNLPHLIFGSPYLHILGWQVCITEPIFVIYLSKSVTFYY